MIDLLSGFLTLIEPFAELIAVVITLAFSGLGGLLIKFAKDNSNLSRANERLRIENKSLEADKTALRDALSEAETEILNYTKLVQGDGTNVWARAPVRFPELYHQSLAASIPIVTFANLKGGVGKTTLAANLAAYFDMQGERVLLIDLDFQGSLTAMATAIQSVDRTTPGALALLRDRRAHTYALVGSKTDSRVIDCYYPFANVETRLMLSWLADKSDKDIRFALSEYLLSNEVQDRFDRVIIDTAPRITTGFINAMCSSTHLVIPTKLDSKSAEAVESFLITVDTLKPSILPGLRELRIAVTDKSSAGALQKGEQFAVEMVRNALQARGQLPQLLLEQAMVPRRADIDSTGGQPVAYFEKRNIQKVIDPLGDELARMAPRLRRAR